MDFQAHAIIFLFFFSNINYCKAHGNRRRCFYYNIMNNKKAIEHDISSLLCDSSILNFKLNKW